MGLDLALAELNATSSNFEREIALLREYRTRLTADVVTGKLDVRTAAESLQEQSDESDQSDLSDIELEPEAENLET